MGFNTIMLDEIFNQINEDRLVFFSITGPAGSGKTYFGMRIAELLDKTFHIIDAPAPPPEEDDGQIAFTREHLNYLLGPSSPLKEYQCLLIDEGHFGLGARSWGKIVQQDIVNLLVACRSKRIIFILVVLNMQQIDKYLREFVVNYQFTMEDRGRATLYRRKFHKLSGDPLVNRLGSWTLPLPDSDDLEACLNPDCIGCKNLYEKRNKEGIRCDNLRARYERRKSEFLSLQGTKEKDKISKNQDDVIIDTCAKFRGDWTYTTQKNIEPASLKIIIKRECPTIQVGRNKLLQLARELNIRYPKGTLPEKNEVIPPST